MGLTPVDDVGLCDSPVDGSQAGLHLGDHPRLQRGQELLERGCADEGHQGVTVGPGGVEPLDVGEHEQGTGLEGHGDRGGGRVGVDVEDGLGVRRQRGDRGDDRDAALVEQVDDGLRADVDDVTDQADIDLVPVHRGQALPGSQEPAVLTADANGGGAVGVEQGDELALHGTGEHHADHVHDLGGGDAQSSAELRGDAQPLEHRVDLGPAAVNDDGAHPDLVQEEDVLGEGAFELIVDHGVAAVLDDHGGALVGAQPRHGLQQDGCLGLWVERGTFHVV